MKECSVQLCHHLRTILMVKASMISVRMKMTWLMPQMLLLQKAKPLQKGITLISIYIYIHRLFEYVYVITCKTCTYQCLNWIRLYAVTIPWLYAVRGIWNDWLTLNCSNFRIWTVQYESNGLNVVDCVHCFF